MKIARKGLIKKFKYFEQQFKQILARTIKTLHTLFGKKFRESKLF